MTNQWIDITKNPAMWGRWVYAVKEGQRRGQYVFFKIWRQQKFILRRRAGGKL
jgi:hypothetical protein